MSIRIPDGYKPVLGIYETQKAISILKRFFEDTLSRELSLMRVSAPLFVDGASGVNDNLNGVERPVSFDIPSAGKSGEVVQSLAKWKRLALHRYGFQPGRGLYTDMNAIRRDEILDNTHSVYVDQWDWEKVITCEERNEKTLKDAVRRIVHSICLTADKLREEFPVLTVRPMEDVTFISSQDLEDMYPSLKPKERENSFLREHQTAFIGQIGGRLRSGIPHDGRAPDYDDWALNGDILVWNETLGEALELSSMGIRVDERSLSRQLTQACCEDRRELPFHRQLLGGELPLTIGGGIGQSRLCMYLLEKAHIGEVQASIWDEETVEASRKAGVTLL